MKTTKIRGADERRVIIAMITNDQFLGRVYSKWEANLFRSSYAQLIANWCIKYYKKYQQAPKRQIESVYESWEQKTKDRDSAKIIYKLLNSLADEYDDQNDINVDYLLDVAARYFNRTRISQLNLNIESLLDSNDVVKAHEALVSYNKIELGLGSGIDYFKDEEAIIEAFKSKDRNLIEYGGALGDFFGKNLGRGDFISFLGKKKIGKSFWLMDMAVRGVLARKRVAYFEVGDMGQSNTIMRLSQRLSQHPRWAGDISYPTKITSTVKDGTKVETKIKTFDKGLNASIVVPRLKKIMSQKIKSKRNYLKVSCHANSSLSIEGLCSILDEWEIKDWIPDIIVIDYADILKMEYQGIEGRDRINETWKSLRRLSQERHVLVVTATQADAGSFQKRLLTMDNFSEDNRKIDHVTGMIGINQSTLEKRMGTTRLNWLALREDEFDPTRCVYVAGCWPIGNPAVKSCWKSKSQKRKK